jgi:Raf kinase inhibitor-like YbhB/YbcL family protein
MDGVNVREASAAERSPVARRKHGRVLAPAAIVFLAHLGVSAAAENESGARSSELRVGRREGEAKMALTLSSASFRPQGEIPAKYTCEGEDVSPALAWSGVPAGTKSLVLIVDDPDAPDPQAPRMTWVHWVLYDIPATATGLPEAVAPVALPRGTREGRNDWKRTGYGGPCPPIGRHRYFHKLYALDVTLGDRGRATKADVVAAMTDHVLASAELIGTYQKQR